MDFFLYPFLFIRFIVETLWSLFKKHFYFFCIISNGSGGLMFMEKRDNGYLIGTIGAILGGLLGTIPWILFMSMQI